VLKIAEFSKDKKYRYSLSRKWSEKEQVLFILLNPSNGDDIKDDPTIRILISISKNLGYGGFKIVNLYTLITPFKYKLYEKKRKFSEKNKKLITELIGRHKTIIYGWGATENEPTWLRHLVKNPLCFQINKNGTPKHPLYLRKESTLKKFIRSEKN
tara:strand:+ start:1445 stop:1912 length:468 start_codon:yes stop_codon:yes gene_type:complete